MKWQSHKQDCNSVTAVPDIATFLLSGSVKDQFETAVPNTLALPVLSFLIRPLSELYALENKGKTFIL